MKFDDIAKLASDAWTHNQTLHTYELHPGAEAILSSQTTDLRVLMSSIQLLQESNTANVDWIDVNDQLPDDCMNVLIATDDGEVDAAFHINDRWEWLTGHTVNGPVLAWCDMPEPPQPTKTDDVEIVEFKQQYACTFALSQRDALIRDAALSMGWLIRQLEGESGASASHWEQYPQYKLALSIRDALKRCAKEGRKA